MSILNTHSILLNSNNVAIAIVTKSKSRDVQYSSDYTKESMNADYDRVLVNAKWGKVSNAKAHDTSYNQNLPFASIVDNNLPNDYLL